MVDAARYRDLFVDEAREHIDVLLAALMQLESGWNAAALDNAFRAAHSMKGMAGTLGFDAEAGLAHAMEDQLSHMRTRQRAEPAILARLVDATDALSASVVAIAGDLERPNLADATVAVGGAVASESARPGTSPPPAELPVPAQLRSAFLRAPSDGRGCVRIQLSKDCIAPRARLLVVRRTIEAFGPVAFVHPGPDAWRALDSATAPAIYFLYHAVAAHDRLLERLGGIADVDEVASVVIEAPTAATQGAPTAAGPSSATVRVPVARVDNLLDRGGEIRIALAQVDRMLDDYFVGGRPYALTEAMVRLERETHALYDSALELRTLPVSVITRRFVRLVRDTAQSLGRTVSLHVEGEATQIDRSVLEALADPVMHLLKNAIAHGIESPEERAAAGKPARASVSIRFERVASGILVEVEDDGRGIDRGRVVSKAIEHGHLDPDTTADSLSDDDLLGLLTLPGFSTAEQVSTSAGRGVGLDVVQARLNEIGGSLSIRSTTGRGSTVRLRLPQTLALVDALECGIDGDPLYVPVDAIVTSLEITTAMRAAGKVTFRDTRAEVARPLSNEGNDVEPMYRSVRLVDLDAVLGLRRRALPYAFASGPGAPSWEGASESLGGLGKTPPASFGVVVEKNGHYACLAVDELGAREELVLKSIDVPGSGPRYVSGAAIRGDGRVGLVIDVPSVLAAKAPRVAGL